MPRRPPPSSKRTSSPASPVSALSRGIYVFWLASAGVLGCGPVVEHDDCSPVPEPLMSSVEEKPSEAEQDPSPSKGPDEDEGRAPSTAPSVPDTLRGVPLHRGAGRTLHASRHDVYFPSDPLVDMEHASQEELARLTPLLDAEYGVSVSGAPEVIGVRPVLQVNLTWAPRASGTSSEGCLDAEETISFHVHHSGAVSGPFTLSRGGQRTIELVCPPLGGREVIPGAGENWGRLHSWADIRMSLVDAHLREGLDLPAIREQLTLTSSVVLSREDLRGLRERVLGKMTHSARAAQCHIGRAMAHANAAEHVSVSSHLSILREAIAQKLARSSPEHFECIVRPDDLPGGASARITSANRHLDHHIHAMVESLASARREATCAHRAFQGLDATRHLRVQD